MGNHPKIFPFAVIALLLFATSPLHADDTPLFSWIKVLSKRAVGIDWSPDGQAIVFGAPDSNEVGLLNSQTGEIIWRTSFSNPDTFGNNAFSARWSRDGKWIAATTENNLYLIDPQTGHSHLLQAPIPSKRDQPKYIAARWGSDSTALAALDKNGFIDIFATVTGKIIQTIDMGIHFAEQNYLTFDWSPDGQLFVAPIWIESVMGPVIGLWDRSGDLLKEYTQESETNPAPGMSCSAGEIGGNSNPYVEWAKDSRTLVVSLTYATEICRLNIDGTIDRQDLESYGNTFHWSPNQRWLAGTLNTYSGIWMADSANNYQLVSSTPPNGASVLSFAWSPDSQHVALGTTHELWIGTFQPPA